MNIKDLLNMDGAAATDWLEANADKYEIIKIVELTGHGVKVEEFSDSFEVALTDDIKATVVHGDGAKREDVKQFATDLADAYNWLLV